MEVASDRRWTFDVPADVLWARMASTDEYRRWWPWLRRFDAKGLVEGDVWGCLVQPPLPYVLRFRVELTAVDPGARADAVVTGDIRGTATLTVEPDGDGAAARLVSSLEPANPVLRAFGAVAAPVVRWGHDWVLDQGLRQFRQRGLR
jgi:hypothetical protein